MRSYREYYHLALEEQKEWLADPQQADGWWKKNEFDRLKNFTVKGDFLPGVKFLTIDQKNDVSCFVNHTNVKNSEIDMLFFMLGQALIDWCVENGKTEFWSFDLSVNRALDGLTEYYVPSIKVSVPAGEYGYDIISDKKELKKWDECGNFLCDIIWEFIHTHRHDIPNDWNNICFGLDDLPASVKAGEWVCFSDGYINMGCKTNDDYDVYVECM